MPIAENARLAGSNTPTESSLCGTNTTTPPLAKTAPMYSRHVADVLLLMSTVVNVRLATSNSPTLACPCGPNTTSPPDVAAAP